jgi:ribosome recycling factor
MMAATYSVKGSRDMAAALLRYRLVASRSMASISTSAPTFSFHSQRPILVSWRYTTMTTTRWKHAGKVGHRLETLDELAHRPEREAAEERRKKKKDKKEVKKGGKTKAAPGVGDVALEDQNVEVFDESDEDIYDDDDDDSQVGDEDVEIALPVPKEVKDKMMMLARAKFEESLKAIRGAEPSPEIFDDIQVNAYGEMTPLKSVGQVVMVSATMAHVTCFDPSVGKEVQKAVQFALNLNPQLEEGGIVKVPLPRVSMETRLQTVKQLNKKAEAFRQRIRQIRRKAMDVVKKGKDGKLPHISKDDAFAVGKELEQVTEDVLGLIKDLVDKKMDSIMAV